MQHMTANKMQIGHFFLPSTIRVNQAHQQQPEDRGTWSFSCCCGLGAGEPSWQPQPGICTWTMVSREWSNVHQVCASSSS